ncbi:response regulator transcription factor [Candidatus Villigracilis affinis]|jgi:two-component system NarL family response regulator|uniref:response regulator transcription factor n=1 Tax=Candidatus Villigracilis affinis TaxID=3140682 RepID=UPI001DF72595|nr:response regulator transcription factor [Anaerolineales bacterium]
MKKIRVMLVDDHALFREGLAVIIGSQPDMEVVGNANDGLEAVIKSQELKPDLILMDIQMSTMDGLEATRQIKQLLPDTTIVVLTVRDDDEKLFEALKSGAQGYLLKDIRSHKMVEMLHNAINGEAAITPSLAGRVLAEFRRMSLNQKSDTDLPNEDNSLTDRELEVLSLVAKGASDRDVAEKLTVSLNTVKTHIRNILSKLRVNSRREAAKLAQSKGLL